MSPPKMNRLALGLQMSAAKAEKEQNGPEMGPEQVCGAYILRGFNTLE